MRSSHDFIVKGLNWEISNLSIRAGFLGQILFIVHIIAKKCIYIFEYLSNIFETFLRGLVIVKSMQGKN